MAPRTVYANLPDGLANLNLWDQSLADMGSLGMIPCTASGTNAIVLTPIPSAFTPNITNPPSQLQNFVFAAPATSNGPVTVQIFNTTNFLKLYRMDAATQAASGDVQNAVVYTVTFNSALNSGAGGFQIQSPISNEINPIITGATISSSTISGSTITGSSINSTAITTSTYNGNTWTAGTGTLTINGSKTLTVNNTLAFSGTDGTTMTFPSTSATIARTDTGQTFTGTNIFATISGSTFTAGSVTSSTVNNTNTVTLTAGNFTIQDATDNTKQAQFVASSIATGTLRQYTLPNGSDTLVALTIPATLTNKTIDTAGPNTIKVNGVTVSAGQYAGTATNDNATAGNIGEEIKSVIVVGSAVSLTTGTAKTVTSITLTAGDWDVSGNIYFNLGGTTTITLTQGGINTTTNAFPGAPDGTVGYTGWQVPGGSAVTGSAQPLAAGPFRQSVSTSTTIFLVAFANFATSTCAAYGTIRARRMR